MRALGIPGRWLVSRIVSPIPPVTYPKDWEPPPGAQWWRLDLADRRDQDGAVYVHRNNGGESGLDAATWCEVEFFDGHDTVLDMGFDKPTVYQIKITTMYAGCRVAWMDLLCIDGPPTPCPDWQPICPPVDY